MNTIDDAEIHQIVQRVLKQLTGASQPAVALPSTPVPGPTPSPSSSPSGTRSNLPLRDASQEKGVSDGGSGKKVVAIGSDHGGFELKEILKTSLNELGFDVRDVGAYNKGAVDYPDFAHEVGRLVSVGKAWRGIMIDGAGIGSCIVANKVPGIRAGMAYDYSSAVNSREHNDTNVLTLGAGLIGVNLAKQIVKVWLTTDFGGGRHAGRVDKITAVEKLYLK